MAAGSLSAGDSSRIAGTVWLARQFLGIADTGLRLDRTIVRAAVTSTPSATAAAAATPTRCARILAFSLIFLAVAYGFFLGLFEIAFFRRVVVR